MQYDSDPIDGVTEQSLRVDGVKALQHNAVGQKLDLASHIQGYSDEVRGRADSAFRLAEMNGINLFRKGE